MSCGKLSVAHFSPLLMSGRLSIANLLNPELSISVSSLLNPAPATSHPTTSADSGSFQAAPAGTLIYSDFRLTKKTTLSAVYLHQSGSVVEYPATGAVDGASVGHLFAMDINKWSKPSLNFVYSRGEPKGKALETVTVPLLVDSVTGEMVPCVARHSTCQGVKVCPTSHLCVDPASHSTGSRQNVHDRLHKDRKCHDETSSPANDVLDRTLALITSAISRVGCTSKSALDLELEEDEDSIESRERRELRRGYPDIPRRCTGSIIFRYTSDGTPFIKCEYHSRENRDHFFDISVGNGRYNTDYLQAVLDNNIEESTRIECEAEANGYGPKVPCRTVVNRSSQRPTCGFIHRDPQRHELRQMKLIELSCTCKFWEYEPVAEYRERCAYLLIVSKNVHSHPAPLPEKTPIAVRAALDSLLQKLEYELADMTPRIFLRHPLVKSYLSSCFPLLRNPMLSDLHISLSNQSHLKIYIQHMKKSIFPFGTGWKGLLHLKSQQDNLLDPSEQYIRAALEIPVSLLAAEDNDNPSDGLSSDEPLRIVICMTPHASRRLIEAQYIQSDISFKRVVGFYEFEIASVDPYTNTKIDDYGGLIVNWVVDQHGGQAKGIGLYLYEQVQMLPEQYDFHEPSRLIQDLNAYDHLRRFLTLCTTHFTRNIQKCAVSEEVRSLMRSLSCIRHDDWDGTISTIIHLGGQPAQSTFRYSQRIKFMIELLRLGLGQGALTICWEKSFIPMEIWQARRRESNVVEIVHANVNREGTQCTLVGGVSKGQHYDLMKQRAVQDWEEFGIRESYSLKRTSENAIKNYKRKAYSRQKILNQDDSNIKIHNGKMEKLRAKWHQAQDSVDSISESVQIQPAVSSLSFVSSPELIKKLNKAQKKEEKARKAYEKQVGRGRELAGKGSGQVSSLLS
ncbi:hypothetical protein D9757_012737 [Collybiopsis confluens]|uniref:Uncharacterized protein n=1 Tax=Collybiopsis confluens TaxID=2823264 RepID=A0A8H5FX60_9AGAR|nr:hypothetical protein D9757_012737 [Collybiopsis confluens]